MDGSGPDQVGEWVAAGLCDPASPGAAERLELLAWLTGQGATVAQMVEADLAGRLSGLVGDLALRPGERFGIVEMAARASLPVGRVREIMRAMGLHPAADDEEVFTDDDVVSFRGFEEAARTFGHDHMLQFTRTMTRALARVAEAAVSLFLEGVEGPLREQPHHELALARANAEAVDVVGRVLAPVMDNLFRLLMDDAIRRSHGARLATGSLRTGLLAVGFVDLVGFTSLSRELSPSGLSEVVDRFEADAVSVTADHGGHVVKFIGDEVMFVAPDPAAGCRVALDLVDRFRGAGPDATPDGDATGPAGVTPRGCVAWGEVLIRGGDYYGSTVNLASRAAELAVPCEVLVTGPAREGAVGAGDDLAFEGAGRRNLRGFDGPVALWSVARLAPHPGA